MTSMVTRRSRTPTASPQAPAEEAHIQPTIAPSSTARYFFLLSSIVSVGYLCYSHASPGQKSLSNLSEREIHASTPANTHVYPRAERLVAIGDLHGDFEATRRVLIRVGVLSNDLEDNWVGGSTVLVQVGDQQDRGDGELQIYDLLYRLQDEAPKFGGAVRILLGNHELMNTELYLRYVTPGGFQEFEDRHQQSLPISESISDSMKQKILSLPEHKRARAWQVVSGGNLSKRISRRQHIALVVGDSVFVHGGLSVDNIERHGGIEELNEATRKYLAGETEIPFFLDDSKISPLWLRMYSQGDIQSEGYECRQLSKVLKLLGARRMIVGHTVQKEGINSRCNQQIWRADVGMSRAYGGETEALIIVEDKDISILTMDSKVNGTERSY